MEHIRTHKNLIVAGSFITNLSILAAFKYYNFFSDAIAELFYDLGIAVSIPRFDVLLPVGISFYIFQALGYTMDVYRGEVEAEKNFVNYALFVSFFPQLVAGPIERTKISCTRSKSPIILKRRGLRMACSLWCGDSLKRSSSQTRLQF